MAPPNLAAFRLPSTRALDGQKFTVEGVAGGTAELAFDGPAVQWSTTGMGWPAGGADSVDVVEVAPETFFVDIDVTCPANDALTAVLSCATGWALLIHQRRDPLVRGRGPAASHAFAVARVAGYAQHGPPPGPTRDLVGRWHRYRYSPDNLYEHVYVSGDRFVSHNLETVNTADRVDCHPVSYYKIASELYVVAWREFDSQASMVTFENLADSRSTGKVLHPTGGDRSGNSPIGGVILPVTVTFPVEDS